ncbi:hypothetical protein AB833_20840 [Chromatiales bacterium (ex Bugula neritina AB1)]|nr:hypothetical protein AB833_20840 [Chromatiales bacterium (ex Bugula neritina AB1)]
MKNIGNAVVVCAVVSTVISLYQGNYPVAILQAIPVLIKVLLLIFPNGKVAGVLTLEMGPERCHSQNPGEYSLRMAVFSSKCALLVLLIWSAAFTIDFDIDNNNFLLGVFAFVLPVLFAMAISATMFQLQRCGYFRFSRRN